MFCLFPADGLEESLSFDLLCECEMWLMFDFGTSSPPGSSVSHESVLCKRLLDLSALFCSKHFIVKLNFVVYSKLFSFIVVNLAVNSEASV